MERHPDSVEGGPGGGCWRRHSCRGRARGSPLSAPGADSGKGPGKGASPGRQPSSGTMPHSKPPEGPPTPRSLPRGAPLPRGTSVAPRYAFACSPQAASRPSRCPLAPARSIGGPESRAAPCPAGRRTSPPRFLASSGPNTVEAVMSTSATFLATLLGMLMLLSGTRKECRVPQSEPAPVRSSCLPSRVASDVHRGVFFAARNARRAAP